MYPMYSRRIAPRLPFRLSSRCASLADRNSNFGNPALLQISSVRCNASYHRGCERSELLDGELALAASPNRTARRFRLSLGFEWGGMRMRIVWEIAGTMPLYARVAVVRKC